MQGHSKITDIKIQLKGKFPFPITIGNSADPAFVEKDIATTAQAILDPRSSTPGQPERFPFVFIPDLPERYLLENGRYKVPFDAEDRFTPLPDDKAADCCSMIVKNSPEGISMQFNNAATRAPLRTVVYDHVNFSEAMFRYLRKQLEVGDKITDLQKKHDALPETATAARKDLLLDMQAHERSRRGAHNSGAELILNEAREQGVYLRNKAMPRNLDMKVFELFSLLTRMGETYPAPACDPFARRQPGSYQDLRIRFSPDA